MKTIFHNENANVFLIKGGIANIKDEINEELSLSLLNEGTVNSVSYFMILITRTCLESKLWNFPPASCHLLLVLKASGHIPLAGFLNSFF